MVESCFKHKFKFHGTVCPACQAEKAEAPAPRSNEEKISQISSLLQSEKWDWDLCSKIADVLDDAK